MDMGILVIAGIVLAAVVFFVLVLKSMWRVAEPNEALIISGLKAGRTDSQDADAANLGFRVVTGQGTLVIPGLQTVRRLSLDIMEAQLRVRCVTQQGIEVGVQGVVIFKIGDDTASISNAARRFLDQQQSMVTRIVNVFEGHLRSIIGSLTMEELVRERERLTQETASAAGVELEKLGLIIDTLQIQELDDPTGYIKNLARPHAAEVEKQARIAQAQSDQVASQSEAEAAARKAEAVRSSQIAQSQYQAEVDRAAAIAQQAGPLAAADARRAVVEQETQVAKLEAARREQVLEAEVRRPADAARYRTEQEAQAARSRTIAEAEAERARRALIAEAVRLEGEASAAATKVTGEAEAAAILARGLAEAEAIEKRAQALATNGDAVVLQQLAENYPAVVQAAAGAFAGVDSFQVLNGAQGVTDSLVNVIAQGLTGFGVLRGMLPGAQADTAAAALPSGAESA